MNVLAAPAVDYPEAPAISVILAERTTLLREALATVLSTEDDLDIVAVGTVAELLPTARTLRPDVVVVNIDLLTAAGFAVIKDLAELAPGCETVVLADGENATGLHAVLDGQVRGLVDRDLAPGRLAECIRRVARGERVVDQNLAIAAQRAPRNPFTARERDVLGAIALGLPSADIAARLRLTNGTVGNYVSTIIRKTGARNRLEAVRVAEEAGWIRAPGRPGRSR